MSTFTPDFWVAVEIKMQNVDTATKILAGWHDSSGNETWQLSSGIKSILDKGSYLEMLQHSGSLYNCYKNCYRTSRLTKSKFNMFENMLSSSGGEIRILGLSEIYATP